MGESGDNVKPLGWSDGSNPVAARKSTESKKSSNAITAAEATVFVGVHERQLDPKGRLGLPASFRPRLEPRCYLSIGRDKCVDILTAEAFEAVAKDAVEKVRSGEMDRNQQRALASNTFEVVVDAQGRINIDEILREYAGLTLNSRVVVSGSFDRAEIWDPTRHQRISDEGLQQIAGTGQ